MGAANRPTRHLWPLCFLCLLVAEQSSAVRGDSTKVEAKPKVAIFPLAGDAKEDLRAKCGFSLRAKLDRTEKYEVLDGYTMADLAESAAEPVGVSTGVDAVKELGAKVEAAVLIWGELKNEAGGATMRLKILDLREKDPKPRDLEKVITDPTDLRFVAEQILETLPGVGAFEHPNEEAVTNDAAAEQLWKTNRNLVSNWDFSDDGAWTALYMSEKYKVRISDALPAVDKVNICRLPAEESPDGKPNTVLAMNLSQFCAENNGMACLSEQFKIEPDTRYRIQFRYKSDGPVLHVFVKGYTMGEDIKGKKTPREIYRRQVPPTGATGGKWVTVVDDLNPQHVAFPVQYLKVDLYAYASAGVVMFDDVVVKAVGRQTRDAKDKAIDKPVERPKGVVEKEKRLAEKAGPKAK